MGRQRGYDGNGDYGYDVAASRSEASTYRARAAQAYPVPGTPDDPWGPYIHEAAARFQVPERWICEVMRQGSGGNRAGADGAPWLPPAPARWGCRSVPGRCAASPASAPSRRRWT